MQPKKMNRFKRTLKFQQKLLMFNSYICASFYGSVRSNVYVPLLIDIRTENKSVKGRIVRKAIAAFLTVYSKQKKLIPIPRLQ